MSDGQSYAERMIDLRKRVSAALDANDPVNHPLHYGGADDPYEAIKVIEAWGYDEDFYIGSVLKYLKRAGKKGDTITCLRKAQWYLTRKIERLEAKQ